MEGGGQLLVFPGFHHMAEGFYAIDPPGKQHGGLLAACEPELEQDLQVVHVRLHKEQVRDSRLEGYLLYQA